MGVFVWCQATACAKSNSSLYCTLVQGSCGRFMVCFYAPDSSPLLCLLRRFSGAVSASEICLLRILLVEGSDGIHHTSRNCLPSSGFLRFAVRARTGNREVWEWSPTRMPSRQLASAGQFLLNFWPPLHGVRNSCRRSKPCSS